MKVRTWVLIALGVAGLVAVLWYAHWQRVIKTEDMLTALEEADYDKAREAVEWLTKRGHAVVPRLNEIVEVEAKPAAARWRAAGILAEIGDRRSQEPLIGVLSAYLKRVEPPKPEQMAVAAATAQALGRLEAAAAIPELTQLVAKKDAGLDVRCGAARALGRLRAKSTVGQIAAVLGDHPPVPKKTEGAKAAEVKKPADLTIPLRVAACEALAAIGDKAAIPSLMEAADQRVEPDLTVRRAATAALGDSGDNRALPILEENLKDIKEKPGASGVVPDTDGDIRVAAAVSLGEIGDPKAKPALTAARKDKDYWVRRAARRSLRELP